MKYVLDFDRTIFDTDRFIKALKARGLYRRIYTDPHTLDIFAEHENVASFVFPDAEAFLDQRAESIIVLSSATGTVASKAIIEDRRRFLEEKIRRSGVYERVAEVHIVDAGKKEVLRELAERYGAENIVFIDDLMEHVRDAQELGIRAFRRSRSCRTSFESLERDSGCVERLTDLAL